MKSCPTFATGLVTLLAATVAQAQYLPDWDSLDARPLPAWFDQAKLGIFIHWGVYSVPAASNDWFGEEWFEWAWKSGHNYPGDGGTPTPGPGSPKLVEFMNKNYPPGTTYEDLAHDFTAEFWNPDEWVRMFERAGAKYIVLTAKHHEGYTLWPSQYAPGWNSVEVGPRRDLVGDLGAAVRQANLRYGVYHSYTDWFHPLWLQDKANGYSTQYFVENKTDPELYELVNDYHPDIIWSDGEWAPDTYWKAKEFLAWLYNDSPVKEDVIVNDRWGWDTTNTHGGFHSGNDRQNPGILLPHKWENCFTLDKYSWGYRRDNRLEDYMSPEEVVRTLVETVSCGGNALINVAPMKDGTIAKIEQERLYQLGDWLRINGEAIYESVPYTVQNDTITPGVWYTQNADRTATYAIITRWPMTEAANTVQLGSIPYTGSMNIQLLGNEDAGNLQFAFANPGVTVLLPPHQLVNTKYAATLKITR